MLRLCLFLSPISCISAFQLRVLATHTHTHSHSWHLLLDGTLRAQRPLPRPVAIMYVSCRLRRPQPCWQAAQVPRCVTFICNWLRISLERAECLVDHMKSLQRDAGRGKGRGRVEGRDSLRQFEDALQQRQLRALRQIKVHQLNLTLDTRERDEDTSATESCQRCATLSPFWDTQDNFDR